MTRNPNDSTGWEKIVRFFENSWIGISILIVLTVVDVASDNYDTLKTYKTDTQARSINNTLTNLNDQICKSVKSDDDIDSIRVSIRQYLTIRNSLNEPPFPETKKRESALLHELFNYTHSLLGKYAESVRSDRPTEVSMYKKKLIPLCNEIENLCEKTSLCSNAEMNTLKTTINALSNTL